MILLEALDFTSKDRVAFIGSGGKTTAIFQIARQFNQKVLVTTSTHLGEQEANVADDHLIVRNLNDLLTIPFMEMGKIILITGPNNGEGKLTGLSLDMMKELMDIATDLDCPVLIEADGSRRRPLKAFAEHEPDIPEGVNHIVVVAGISAIGKRLTEDWVHRPELFSNQTDIAMGSPITLDSIKTILEPPLGGLKNISEGIEFYLIINQTDTTEKAIKAGKLSDDLINFYSKIVITSLIRGDNVLACKKAIAGILLAGGGSERLGEPKQFVPWRNTTFVEGILDTMRITELEPIIVVTGASHKEMVEVLKGQDVIQVQNTDWKEGQSTSIRAGLNTLTRSGKRVDGAMFFLVDQPQLSVSFINSIVEATYTSTSKVIAPLVDSKRSNPVYFNKKAFPDLQEIKGDKGGRVLFSKYSPKYIEWLDSTMGLDCDTLEDLYNLRKFE